MKKSGIKTLSLFTGAGGLDIGFHLAGFDIVACVELEQKYCKTLEKNKALGRYFGKDTKIHNVDIRAFDVNPYKGMGIECVIGGPPCQTFSAAGRRAGGVIGTDDQRGQLYEAYCNILDEINPKVFVFENVYGIFGANGGEPWKDITAAFSSRGYELSAEIIDTADYSVPQHRERVIMVGAKGKKFKFPAPIVGPDSNTGESLVSVYEAIKDLQKNNEKFGDGLGGMYGHLLPDVPEGLNYAFFTAEMGHPEPVFAWRSKFHDLLYKVNRNEPCRTIKASPGKFTGPFHWKNRHFSIAELKRLQTFPDDYEITGSYGHIVEQIGNSVPPKLAEIIAWSVKDQLLEPKKKLRFEVRDASFKSTFRQRQRAKSKNFKLIAQKAIKKRYGEITHYQETEKIKPKSSKYYVTYANTFDRVSFLKKPQTTDYCISCTLTEAGDHIRLDVDSEESLQSDHFHFEIRITGLKKYLPQFDSLTLNVTFSDWRFLFFSWREVELTLTNRSKFFTLIDIYGHYANRGDVVDITTVSKNGWHDKVFEVFEYFSQTKNCGYFVSEESLLLKFQLSRDELDYAVKRLRELRYDIRTFSSHPIIGKGNVLCTYPFPLLSSKAMVKSKAKLTNGKIDEE